MRQISSSPYKMEGILVIIISLLVFSCLFPVASLAKQKRLYVESPHSTRILGSEEDTRLGHTHYTSGNYGFAVRYYRNAVSINRRNLAAWIGLAAAYDRLHRFDLARKAYRNAILIGGRSYIILNNQAFALLVKGQYSAARRLLYRARNLSPDNIIIQNNIELAIKGTEHFRMISPWTR